MAANLAAIVPASARTIVSLDQGWSFYQVEAKGAEKPEFPDAAWQKIDVPHD